MRVCRVYELVIIIDVVLCFYNGDACRNFDGAPQALVQLNSSARQTRRCRDAYTGR